MIMLDLRINDKRLMPVRLLPFITGWRFSPDVVADILAGKNTIYGIKLTSYHFDQQGEHAEILAKEWDGISLKLEALNATLDQKEESKNELYGLWRKQSTRILPASTFVWLDEFESEWYAALSEMRMHIIDERPRDRDLNLSPNVPADLVKTVYAGFSALISKPTRNPVGKHPRFIRYHELLHFMIIDPFYGHDAEATNFLIRSIYKEHAHDPRFRNFRDGFSLKPCKSEAQQHLIYIWCALMGLPAYRDGKLLAWSANDFLSNWTADFDLNRTELQGFLRQHELPLPTYYFPDEIDNTERKVALDDETYAQANDFAVELPRLENKLDELESCRPETWQDKKERDEAIAEVQQQIQVIKSGGSNDETPDQRKQRLESWLAEEKRLRGERGALTRTAEREGIKRQTLSAILKKKA